MRVAIEVPAGRAVLLAVILAAVCAAPRVGEAGRTETLALPVLIPRHAVGSLSPLPALRHAELDLGPLAAAATPVVLQFEGLGGNPSSGFLPLLLRPDPTLGVGPGHVFQMVSATVGRISDKSGTPLVTFTGDVFFHTDFDFPNQPRVLYDALSGRWFATVVGIRSLFPLNQFQGVLALAVSTTSDPTGTFCHYRVGDPTSEVFHHDYPMLGVSDDKIVISYDGLSLPESNSIGSGYYVLNKADLTACAPTARMVRVAPSLSRTTPHPAQSLNSTSDLYMAMHGAGSALAVLTVSGVPGVTAVTEATTGVPIREWLAPPNAPQAGSAVQIITRGERVQSVAWQDRALWLAGAESCTLAVPGGELSCLRLIEFRTDTGEVRQDIPFGSPGEYYVYPALRPDAAGNVHVVFAASSPSSFVGVRVTGRRAGDLLNTLQPAIEIRGGTKPIPTLQFQGTVTDLLGAYFSAAGDPSDPSAVWVTGQYAGGTTVGTTIAQLRFMPGVPPAFGGGVFVVAGDVDGVPGDEIITGPGAGSGPHVRIVKVDGAGQASVLGPGLFPYAVSFTGGVRVAACDFDGDLRAEIVTGAGPGGGPHVRVSKLDPAGKPTGDLASFFAYDPAFLGGVFVACGDIDGDGVSDLVTGADAGGGPHVRVFRLQIGAPGGVVPILEFFAFDPTFAGGIRVAAANVDGSDRATVVVGAGPGGGPHVRALKLVGGTLQEMASFFAYDLGFGGGVFVAAGQVLPGVGHAEIVTGAGAGGGPHVRVFAATGADAGVGFFAYSPAFTGGVHVTVLNVAALAPGEIVTAAGAGGGPHVRAFTGFGVPLSSISFFAY